MEGKNKTTVTDE